MWDLQGHPTGPPQCFAPDMGEVLPSCSQPVPSPFGGDASAWQAVFGWRPSEEARDWICSQRPATRGTSDVPALTSCARRLPSHFPALPTLGALPAGLLGSQRPRASSCFSLAARVSTARGHQPRRKTLVPLLHTTQCSRRLLGPVPAGLTEGCAVFGHGEGHALCV